MSIGSADKAYYYRASLYCSQLGCTFVWSNCLINQSTNLIIIVREAIRCYLVAIHNSSSLIVLLAFLVELNCFLHSKSHGTDSGVSSCGTYHTMSMLQELTKTYPDNLNFSSCICWFDRGSSLKACCKAQPCYWLHSLWKHRTRYIIEHVYKVFACFSSFCVTCTGIVNLYTP